MLASPSQHWRCRAQLMLGQVNIAKRLSYTKIEFLDDETFERACSEYRRRGLPEGYAE